MDAQGSDVSDMRSLSLSSGDEGRFGAFRGEEDLDYLELSPDRMVAARGPWPNGSALDAATRVVRQNYGRGPPRTGGVRIERSGASFRRMTDEQLERELVLFQDELYARYGTPPASDDEKSE